MQLRFFETVNVATIILGIWAFSFPFTGAAFHNLLLLLFLISFLARKENYKELAASFTNSTVMLSLGLFALLTATYLFNNTTEQPLSTLLKYKEFVILPFIAAALISTPSRKFTFKFLYIGVLINLVSSYAMFISGITIEEGAGAFTFTGRILHGLLVNILLASSLYLLNKETRKKYKLLLIIIIGLAILNIFLIVPGRTGQLITTVLLLIFFTEKYEKNNLLKNITAYTVILFSLTLIFNSSDRTRIFNSELIPNQSLQNTDQRFSFYINGIKLITEEPITGYGIGNVYQPYLEIKSREGNKDMFGSSVNLHSQFIQIGVESGIPAIVIFCLIIMSLIKPYKHLDKKLVLAIFSIVGIQNLFNSSFMDHGDGWMLTILIAFLVGKYISRRPSTY